MKAHWILSLTFIVAGAALGQGGPDGGFGGPPPRPAGPPMGPGLLMSPEVQKELKLQKVQIAKLSAFVPHPPSPGQRPLPPDQERRLGPREMEDKVRGILNAAQFRRYEQIMLQVAGPVAVSRPDVAARIGLTEAQKVQLAKITSPFRAPKQESSRPPQPPSREVREKANAEVLKVLTSEQKAKWRSLLGAPFNLRQPEGIR